MRDRLSSRLLATTAVALVATVFCLVVLLLQFNGLRPELLIVRELETAASQITDGMRFHADGNVERVALPDFMQSVYAKLPDDNAYRILDRAGRVVLSSDGASAPFMPTDAPFDPRRARFDVQSNGVTHRIYTATLDHGGETFHVQVMRSDRIHRASLDMRRDRSVFLLVIIIALPMAVFSLVVFNTLRRMVLLPLKTMTSAAARIGPHNLGARLSTVGLPSEMTPLIDSFNLTLARLEHGFTVQREFLAAAAHELKTPIALMRGQIELDGVHDRALLLQDLDHMARQVSQLLHLAEVSERHNYRFVSLALDPIVHDVLRHLERLASRQAVTLEYHAAAAGVRVSGDNGGVFMLIRNLVENAIHHAPPGTAVIVQLNAEAFSVSDAGPGIGAADMPLIFDRFWRGKHRRDAGAGLGLSICREISAAHGWRIEVDNVLPGARFSVIFG